jgi:hypothetical protein
MENGEGDRPRFAEVKRLPFQPHLGGYISCHRQALDVVRYRASARDVIFEVIWFEGLIYEQDMVNMRSDRI